MFRIISVVETLKTTWISNFINFKEVRLKTFLAYQGLSQVKNDRQTHRTCYSSKDIGTEVYDDDNGCVLYGRNGQNNGLNPTLCTRIDKRNPVDRSYRQMARGIMIYQPGYPDRSRALQ